MASISYAATTISYEGQEEVVDMSALQHVTMEEEAQPQPSPAPAPASRAPGRLAVAKVRKSRSPKAVTRARRSRSPTRL